MNEIDMLALHFPSERNTFVLKSRVLNFRYCFALQCVIWRNWTCSLARSLPPSLSLCLRVSLQLKASTSRPGETFLECLIGTVTRRQDDGLHTARLHHRPGPGCSSGLHGGERAVRAGGHPATAATAAAAQHRKSGRGFQDGPGDEDNRQHR